MVGTPEAAFGVKLVYDAPTITIPTPTGKPPAIGRNLPFGFRRGFAAERSHVYLFDTGSLGGTHNEAQCINNRGQVIGWSNLTRDPIRHAFLWQNGRMHDLGTLGGPVSKAWWINDSGEIAGSADLPTPGQHDAVIWKHGRIHDLGTVPGDPCSRAYGLNSRGQVVGGSSSCRAFLHAFVWQNGGPMMDLNALIQPGTGYQLTNAIDINDRGEIIAKAAPVGFTPDDDADLGHLALLIP